MTLHARQNDPAMLSLLRAGSVSHKRVRRLDGLRTALSVIVAGSALVATLVDTAVVPVAVVGALWGLAHSVGLASWTTNELRRTALIQETFDVELFGLPWNAVLAGDQLGPHDISRLAQRCTGDGASLRNYYTAPDLPRPYDVLAAQLQNLGWGARVRRRYAHAILVGAATWAGAGLIIGGATGLSVGQLALRWYVPSLGALLLAVDIYRAQREIAAERERALSHVRTEIALTAGEELASKVHDQLITLTRHVQDVIFLTRLRQPQVPDWFFQRFRTRDRVDFEVALIELVSTAAAD